MMSNEDTDDELEDDLPQDEGPGDDDADLLDENEPATAPCPSCGHDVYEEAWRCEHCGADIGGSLDRSSCHRDPLLPQGERARGTSVPSWVYVTAVLVLIAIFWMYRQMSR